MIVRTVHQSDRLAWLAARADYFGASDIPRLLCEAPAKSEQERAGQRALLIAEKAGLVRPFAGNETTELGQELEEPLVDIARRRLNLDIEPCGQWTTNSRYAGLGCTPDAFVRIGGARYPLNIKVTSSQATEDCRPRKNGDASTAAFSAGLPLYFRVQAVTEAMVCETSHGFMGVLHTAAGLKLRLYCQPLHAGLAQRIAREVSVAWGDVERLRKERAA